MKLATKQLPNQTLLSSVGTNNLTTGIALLDDCYAVMLMTSALTSVVTVQIEPTDTGANWTNLYSGGALVNLQASGAIVISPVPFRQIRVSAAATEGANRTVVILGQIVV